MFIKDPKQNIEVKASTQKGQKELDLHRVIKIRKRDNVCLYISNRLANFGEVDNVGTSKSFYSGFELVDLSPNFHNVQQFISLLTLF